MEVPRREPGNQTTTDIPCASRLAHFAPFSFPGSRLRTHVTRGSAPRFQAEPVNHGGSQAGAWEPDNHRHSLRIAAHALLRNLFPNDTMLVIFPTLRPRPRRTRPFLFHLLTGKSFCLRCPTVRPAPKQFGRETAELLMDLRETSFKAFRRQYHSRTVGSTTHSNNHGIKCSIYGNSGSLGKVLQRLFGYAIRI